MSEERQFSQDNPMPSGEISDRLRESEALLAISATASSTLDVREALRRICREVTRLFGADCGAVYLRRRGRSALSHRGLPCRRSRRDALATPLPLREQFYVPLWNERRPSSHRMSPRTPLQP
jgi:GAF domain-containing protein